MRLYAQRPDKRLSQVLADLGMLAWVVLWVVVARVVHAAVLVLAEPGAAVESLGVSVAESMGSAADVADDVPVVGDELAVPFDALGSAGDSVSGAGQSAQDAAGTLASWLAVVLVVLPVGWLLLRWLPWRLAWAREASAVGRMVDSTAPDLDLLAARAVVTAPLARLAALPSGTGAAWRAGDPAATRALAALEADRLGLRLPPLPDSGPTAPG
jgi:hypothetical protein